MRKLGQGLRVINQRREDIFNQLYTKNPELDGWSVSESPDLT